MLGAVGLSPGGVSPVPCSLLYNNYFGMACPIIALAVLAAFPWPVLCQPTQHLVPPVESSCDSERAGKDPAASRDTQDSTTWLRHDGSTGFTECGADECNGSQHVLSSSSTQLDRRARCQPRVRQPRYNGTAAAAWDGICSITDYLVAHWQFFSALIALVLMTACELRRACYVLWLNASQPAPAAVAEVKSRPTMCATDDGRTVAVYSPAGMYEEHALFAHCKAVYGEVMTFMCSDDAERMECRAAACDAYERECRALRRALAERTAIEASAAATHASNECKYLDIKRASAQRTAADASAAAKRAAVPVAPVTNPANSPFLSESHQQGRGGGPPREKIESRVAGVGASHGHFLRMRIASRSSARVQNGRNRYSALSAEFSAYGS